MRTKFFLYTFFLLSPILALAQPPKAKVEQAVEKLRLAMVSGKKADLEAIASDHLSYGHSHGNVQNKAEFVEAIASGKSDFVAINLSNQTIDIVGQTAVVRHILDADTNDNNKPGKVKLAILLIFQQE
ncbi:MAG: nuclear transport factor 2 family protein, partial [Mucilaginibacter polytrichastri]|nr:nuclear transport factor 2 family protein [Mucilaginibacter polytrichastri]